MTDREKMIQANVERWRRDQAAKAARRLAREQKPEPKKPDPYTPRGLRR